MATTLQQFYRPPETEKSEAERLAYIRDRLYQAATRHRVWWICDNAPHHHWRIGASLSCLKDLYECLELTRNPKTIEEEDAHLLLMRFFYEALIEMPVTGGACEIIKILENVYRDTKHQDERRFKIDVETTGRTMKLLPDALFAKVADAHKKVDDELMNLVCKMTFHLRQGKEFPNRELVPPTPKFAHKITAEVYQALQVRRHLITAKALAEELGYDEDTISKARKELNSLRLLDDKGRSGFSIIPEHRRKYSEKHKIL